MAQRGRHLAPRLRRISRTWVIPLTLVMTLVMGGVAWADQVEADADALSTASNTNSLSANQQPGTTVAYDLSAHIRSTGASANKVFVETGDSVLVNITRSGAWLATSPDAGSPGSFTFTEYGVSQAGTLRIAVPCGIEPGTSQVMSALFEGTPSRGVLNPATRTVTYTITAAGDDHESCAPSNIAPVIAFTTSHTSSNEGDTETFVFSIADDSGDSHSFVSGYPNCGAGNTLSSSSIDNDTHTGTFACLFTDGLDPAVNSLVRVKVQDDATPSLASNELTQNVLVDNVAPTASLSRLGPANVFTGSTVTYNASATDPSSVDTTAGFTWSFDDGTTWTSAQATAQLQQTYNSCGLQTESVLAQDKDGGISNPAGTATVSAYDGGWHGAIKPAMRNMVQKGRVVPVQIRITCDGASISGLSPSIQLLSGDYDPNTDPGDDAVLTPTSVSAADTAGIMRPVDDGYIYNLLIPSNASAGSKYTIRVRPWGLDGAFLTALLEVRK